MTTLNRELARILEPRASVPRLRLEAISRVASAGVPVGVLVAPIIPALDDHEIPQILAAAREAGAAYAYMQVLRLPYALSQLFTDWLHAHLPDRADKVLNRIRAMRQGKLNVAEFGKRMTGKGLFAEQIHRLFVTSRKKVGLQPHGPSLSATTFRRPGGQLQLF